MRATIDRHEAQKRLQLVFPREAFDTVLSNPLAGTAVAAMIYADAVAEDSAALTRSDRIVRPTSCLWFQDDLLTFDSDSERNEWLAAAASSSSPRRKTEALMNRWSSFAPLYGDNTRETLRDETFAAWAERGAIKELPGTAVNYSLPKWALASTFAALFDPVLTGVELDRAVEAWRGEHLSPMDQLRIQTLRDRQGSAHTVGVQLPGGTTRFLDPGDASHIIKGVIETWAVARLEDPVVLTISQPGDKVYVADAAMLARLGITIDARSLLPDLVIVDIGPTPPAVWIIEAVATDGEINERRRSDLLGWAENQRIAPETCQFLTAFLSRNDGAARRRLKDLAVGTYAWYLDEPGRELAWREIESSPVG